MIGNGYDPYTQCSCVVYQFLRRIVPVGPNSMAVKVTFVPFHSWHPTVRWRFRWRLSTIARQRPPAISRPRHSFPLVSPPFGLHIPAAADRQIGGFLTGQSPGHEAASFSRGSVSHTRKRSMRSQRDIPRASTGEHRRAAMGTDGQPRAPDQRAPPRPRTQKRRDFCEGPWRPAAVRRPPRLCGTSGLSR